MGTSDAPLNMTVTQLPMRRRTKPIISEQRKSLAGELGQPTVAADLGNRLTKIKAGPHDIILVDLCIPRRYAESRRRLPHDGNRRDCPMRGEEPEPPQVSSSSRGLEGDAWQFQISRFVIGDPNDPVEIYQSAGGDRRKYQSLARQVGLSRLASGTPRPSAPPVSA
jgi:hypothetical protein